MNKPIEQNAGIGTEKTNQTKKSGPVDSASNASTFTKSDRMPDSKSTTDKAAHQDAPKSAVKEPSTPIPAKPTPAKDAVSAPPRAANGGDESMDQGKKS